MIVIPDKLTVEVDTREKYPLFFPETIEVKNPHRPHNQKCHITTVRTKLDAGDYRLAEFPDSCVIERKATPLELYKNFYTRDSRRQSKAFASLRESCTHPILFIEATPTELFRGACGIDNPEDFVSHLTFQLARLGIDLFWCPCGRVATRRRDTGRMLLHYMVGIVMLKQLLAEARTPGMPNQLHSIGGGRE